MVLCCQVIIVTIVFKVSDNIKEKMMDYYFDKRREKTPPYAIFQADEADTNITLYESGKVMFQGVSADIDANMWIDLEKSLNNRDINAELADAEAKKKDKKEEAKDTRFINVPTIGSDEVGTGDYFGPIVVTASYVAKENMNLLYELGVRDSKKLTDQKIWEIGPTLIKKIPHATYILDNKTYNDKPTIVDQFCHPRNYFGYIYNEPNKYTKITFTTKAEDKCLSVAVSSIICRYIFLREMKKIEDKYNIFLKKGAGLEVDKQGAMLVKKYGESILHDIAKLDFKNTDKIKALLN